MTDQTRTSNARGFGRILALAAVTVLAALAVTLWGGSTLADLKTPAPSRQDGVSVERGKYLVSIAGCHDCHTPWKMGPEGPGPDMSRMLSGHPQDLPIEEAPAAATFPWLSATAATNTAFSGPWGVSFTANLTPDVDTGIGSWSEEIFVNTIRSGKHWGQSRPILPPMPWPVYRNMTDDDLKSVFAYLQTIPPIHNQVPLPLPPAGVAPADEDPFASSTGE